MRHAGFALAALTALAASCQPPPAADRRFEVFGTSVHVEILAAEPPAAAGALGEIEQRFRRAERDWYAFGSGELAAVNGLLARGEPAPVSAGLAPLLARAIELQRRSGGLFDPGVCALVRLWQFDSAESLAAVVAPPTEAERRALRASQGTLADLHFDGRTAVADRPLCIDLGGMAKGTALEEARVVFRRHGISSALVDIGGSSQLAVGLKNGEPWTIGVKHPRANRVLARLRLTPGEAASTSGDYERGYTRNGRRYHHILDPRTGEPATGTASVTALAADAELADAATTALMAGGPARFRDLCAALGIDDALLITTSGELLTTPGMATRLRRDNNGALPVVNDVPYTADL